jgi:hypothetical protein
MKILAVASYPIKAKTKDSKLVACLYAGLLTVFSLGQLFEFNQFSDLFADFNIFGSELFSRLFCALLIVCEVLAIPFLLQMRLSKIFRLLSMIFGWLVSFSWFVLALWMNITMSTVSNFGILGTKIQLVPGWWTISFCTALCILAIWSSWGLWPIKSKK